MNVQKAFRYRAYPSPTQQHSLAVQFGHARFVYNWALAAQRDHYQQHGKGLNYYATAALLKSLKQSADHAWLKEADSQVLQQCHRVENQER